MAAVLTPPLSRRCCFNPLSPVFFNPSFPLTLPFSPFVVILPPLLSHRIGQRRPFREDHQSRLSICNGDSLCPSRGGSRQSTLHFSPSILVHRGSLCFLRFRFPLFASPFRICTTNSIWKYEKERERKKIMDSNWTPAHCKRSCWHWWDIGRRRKRKSSAAPSSLTSPVDPGALNKMDVLGSGIGRNCTVDPLKCHRRRRHGLLDCRFDADASKRVRFRPIPFDLGGRAHLIATFICANFSYCIFHHYRVF